MQSTHPRPQGSRRAPNPKTGHPGVPLPVFFVVLVLVGGCTLTRSQRQAPASAAGGETPASPEGTSQGEVAGSREITAADIIVQGIGMLIRRVRSAGLFANIPARIEVRVGEPFRFCVGLSRAPDVAYRFSAGTALFQIDPQSGVIEFVPSDFDLGVHYATIYVELESGEEIGRGRLIIDVVPAAPAGEEGPEK